MGRILHELRGRGLVRMVHFLIEVLVRGLYMILLMRRMVGLKILLVVLDCFLLLIMLLLVLLRDMLILMLLG